MRIFTASLTAVCLSLAVTVAAEKPVARGECDEATLAAINQRIKKRWPDAEVRLCAAGMFAAGAAGAAGYVINVASAKQHRTGIIAKDAEKDLAEFTDIPQRSVATSIVGYGAADLDGDGVDEVIEWWRKSAHGRMGSDNWLDVRRVENGKLGARIAGPHISIFFPEIGRCHGDWRLERGTLVINIESADRLPPSDCLSVGTHRFKLKDGALRELPAK